MTASRFLILVVTVLTAGTAGWVLNSHLGATGERAAKPVTAPGASSSPAPRPMPEAGAVKPPGTVMLFRDGTVTVNVQDRSLKWLLDEIARQIHEQIPVPATDQPAQAQPGPVDNYVAAPETGTYEQERELATARTQLAIRDADEKIRYDALLQASLRGLPIPPETLKAIYESDASERVRLLAFQQYLGATQSARLEATRATLQDALLSSSTAVRMEAQNLLAELGPPPAAGQVPLPGNE